MSSNVMKLLAFSVYNSILWLKSLKTLGSPLKCVDWSLSYFPGFLKSLLYFIDNYKYFSIYV